MTAEASSIDFTTDFISNHYCTFRKDRLTFSENISPEKSDNSSTKIVFSQNGKPDRVHCDFEVSSFVISGNYYSLISITSVCPIQCVKIDGVKCISVSFNMLL